MPKTIYAPLDPDSITYKALCKNKGGEMAFLPPEGVILAKSVKVQLLESRLGRKFWGWVLNDEQGVEAKPVRIVRLLKGDAGGHFNSCRAPEAGPWDVCICDTGDQVFAFTGERRLPRQDEWWLDGMADAKANDIHRGPSAECVSGTHAPDSHIILEEVEWG